MMARLGASEVVGCDISADGLVDARHRAAGMLNIAFEEASVLDLPYSDRAFDFVCCSGVLHHTSDLERGLGELRRVLRPSGKVLLVVRKRGYSLAGHPADSAARPGHGVPHCGRGHPAS